MNATATTCKYPYLTPLSAYAHRCRCDRCKTFMAGYRKRHRQGPCQLCNDRPADIQVWWYASCWQCVTPDMRAEIRRDSMRGRYAYMGWGVYASH